jgi:hypothetical protein
MHVARLLFLAGLLAAAAVPERALAAERVSVQPFDGSSGPALRQQVARMLRGRGFRVLTSISRVNGTGQYLGLARDHRVTAFVTGELDERRPRYHRVTFLVWNGATGVVLGRWSAAGDPKRLHKAVAKGFWKHLRRALEGAVAPPPPPSDLPPAATMYINASDP